MSGDTVVACLIDDQVHPDLARAGLGETSRTGIAPLPEHARNLLSMHRKATKKCLSFEISHTQSIVHASQGDEKVPVL